MWEKWDIIVTGSGEEGVRQGDGRIKNTDAHAHVCIR